MYHNMGEAGVSLALAVCKVRQQRGFDRLPPCVLQTAQSVLNITLMKKRGDKREGGISYFRPLCDKVKKC